MSWLSELKLLRWCLDPMARLAPAGHHDLNDWFFAVPRVL
jgi:hypothetical protein